MFNPLGMAVGFLVASNRKVSDPLMPALMGGVLPMPMGPIAAVLLADQGGPPAPVPAPKPDPKHIEQAIEAALQRLKQAGRRGATAALNFAAGIAHTIERLPDADRVPLAGPLQRLVTQALALLSETTAPAEGATQPSREGGQEAGRRRS